MVEMLPQPFVDRCRRARFRSLVVKRGRCPVTPLLLWLQGVEPKSSPPCLAFHLAVCCNQAVAEPASKAAARRVWVPAEKQNKPTARASAAASASACYKDTVSAENRELWADEPVDPRYLGEDIDLDTVTLEQLPNLRRRAAVAKESLSMLWLRNARSRLCSSKLR